MSTWGIISKKTVHCFIILFTAFASLFISIPAECQDLPLPIAHWPFDDQSDPTADIIGGCDGDVVGATFVTGNLPPIPGNLACLEFNGSSYVNVDDDPKWTLGDDPFTISAWVKFTQVNSRSPFVAHDNGGGGNAKWIFWYDASGHEPPTGPALRLHVWAGGSFDQAVAPWQPIGGLDAPWYHVVVTRNETEYVLYINGIEVGRDYDSHTILDPSYYLTIGSAESFRFRGLIDDVRIYDQRLLPSQVLELYLSGGIESQSLQLNKQEYGCLELPFPIQQWEFTGLYNQQIQLTDVNTSNPDIKFNLIGPSLAIVLDTSPVTLQESGYYYLYAHCIDATENVNYNFKLKETTVHALPLDYAYPGEFISTAQSELFKIDKSEIISGDPLVITLDDSASNNSNELYVRFGIAPDRGNYDYIFSMPGSDQEIMIPNPTGNQDVYVLVYTALTATPGPYTLTAEQTSIYLNSVSPNYHGNAEEALLLLKGVGFDEDTIVELTNSLSRVSYLADSIDLISDQELLATFNANTVPEGVYSVVVTDSGGSDELVDAFEMVDGVGAVLETDLVVPGSVGNHQVATIWIYYANTGDTAMAAPLLVLRAFQDGKENAILKLGETVPPHGFWTSAMPEGFSTSVQFLAMGDTPGLLQPGESKWVPVQYAGLLKPWTWQPVSFELSYLDAHNTEPVDWATLKVDMKPEDIDQETWDALWINFIAQTGTTWGDYITMLSKDAIYLAKQGQYVSDIEKLLSFEFTQAEGLNIVSELSSARDGYVEAPGIDITFNRVFPVSLTGRYKIGTLGRGWFHNWNYSLTVESDGSVVVNCPGYIRRVFKPDMRPGYDEYFPMSGDHAIFTEYLDGFKLLEQNGIVRVFDSEGKLKYEEDPNNNRITCEYTANQLTGLQHSSSPSLRLDIQYDGNGMLWKITDPNSRVTAFSYDAENEHLMSAVYFDGSIINYDYHTTGNIVKKHALTEISIPNEGGQVYQHFTYNDQGRLENVYKGQPGNEVEKLSFTYDEAGKVYVSDNITRETFEYCLDHRCLTTKSIDPLGNTLDVEYDEDYNLTKTINPLGSQCRYEYSDDGNVVKVIDEMGNITSFEYNYTEAPFTRMTKLIDARLVETIYDYDTSGKGNLESVSYNYGGPQVEESWTYDSNGNTTTWTNRRGQVITYDQYDTSGRLLEKNYPNGTQIIYSYDTRGRLEYGTVNTSKGTTTTSFDYYTDDRLQRVTYSGNAGDKWLEYTYHDNSGLRATCVNHLAHRLEYHYDEYGRLSYIDDGSTNEIVHYYYFDPDDGINVDVGSLERKVLGNGVYTVYDYDEARRLRSLINYLPDDSVLSSYEYGYDNLGRKVSMTTQDGSWIYEYDDIGQLTSWAYLTHDMEYEYDAVGNRLFVTENGSSPIQYDVNDLDQYEQVGGTTYTYDDDGNMEYKYETSGTTTYIYDCENRLVELTGPSNHWLFTYDAFGNRIRVDDNGTVSEFVIDPVGYGDVVGEYESLTGDPVAYYDHGYGLLSYTDKAVGTPESYYFSFDAIGNTSELTDKSTIPNVMNLYSYDPYGNSLVKSEAVDNPFEFIGEYGILNEEYDLEFMRARYYSKALGRFITKDPINISGGLNLYSYVLNNPVNQSDPTGLKRGEYDPNTNWPDWMYDPNLNDFWPYTHPRYGSKSLYRKKTFKENVNDIIDFTVFVWNIIEWTPLVKVWHSVLVSIFKTSELSMPCPPDAVCTEGECECTAAVDPNEIIGPSGYGKWRVVDPESLLPYRVNFENDYTATAPAQIVTISNPLDERFDWSTFNLTGVGFGDIQLTVPPNKQHFETVVPYSYLGVDFEVHVELGIHLTTGIVYANFYSIDPATGLPPAVEYGFLPPEPENPEESTGAGMGYFTYTIKLDDDIVPEQIRSKKLRDNPKMQPMQLRKRIPNIADITFDFGETIATNQVDPHDPSAGTDPEKEAYVSVLLSGAEYVEPRGLSEK